MSSKRKVGFSTLFGLMKRRGPYGLVGLVIFLLPVIIVPFISIFWLAFKGENSDYNFNNIEKNGVQKDAKITYIKVVNNVTINGEHPVIISYLYDDNGIKVKDKFETLDLENIQGLGVDSTVKVLVAGHQSMIKGVGPYTFPGWIFYAATLPFVVVGLILLLVGLIPALKMYNLYKTGIVKDAVIVQAETPKSDGFFPEFKRMLKVNYYFLNEQQQKVFGECEPTDLLFFAENDSPDSIKIFVSENNEHNNCIVPKLEAMKYNWSI